jgi:hypothetical protein
MQIALRRLEDELASYDKATRVAELPGGNQMVRLAADQGYANDQNSLAMMQRRSGRAAELRRGDKVVSALGRSPNIDVLEDREDYKGFRAAIVSTRLKREQLSQFSFYDKQVAHRVSTATSPFVTSCATAPRNPLSSTVVESFSASAANESPSSSNRK